MATIGKLRGRWQLKTRGFLEWTVADIERYEKRWPIGARQRVMLDVYCYMGLRRGDAARVGKQHVSNGDFIGDGKSHAQTIVHLPMQTCSSPPWKPDQLAISHLS